MADSKLSELTSASTINASDLLYLVQSGSDKSLTISNLFANAANVNLSGISGFVGSQTISSPGSIDLNVPVTKLAAGGTSGELTIPTGSKEGQVKYIVMASTGGGVFTLTGNIAGSANVVFAGVGDSASLSFIDGSWYFMGGTATVT